jgi:thiamine-monophosphate kinase
MNKLSEMGEKEAVRHILAEIAEKESSNAIGPGDDAAAVDMGVVYLVATTDMIAQSTHVLPGMTDWQIGWTVAAVNFSDVAAMGAKPIGLLVSMGLPKDTPSERLDEIIRGILDCCEYAGGEMLGGDTKEAPELTLSGTALGTVVKRGILLRKGAKKGDLLAVTGSLGLAAAGYHSMKASLGNKRAEMARCPIPFGPPETSLMRTIRGGNAHSPCSPIGLYGYPFSARSCRPLSLCR